MCVKTLMTALTAWTISTTPVATCYKDCVTSDVGVDLIAYFEGYSPVVYKDAAGFPTIGYGHLIQPGEVLPHVLTPDAAVRLLKRDIALHAAPVNKAVKIELLQNQFDSLVSFTYNLGEGAFRKSTLLKRVNAERHDDVPDQFKRWVYAGGKKLRGLVRRRNAEADLYTDPDSTIVSSLLSE